MDEDEQLNQHIQGWDEHIHDLLRCVDWGREFTRVRRHTSGASLAVSAPVDALYAACELNELAWICATEGRIPSNSEIDRLSKMIQDERRPGLNALQAAANEHNLPWLFDDDAFSIGYGRNSQSWEDGRLPAPEDINWSKLGTLPVILVTGTNGKTTTSRLLRAVALAAKLNPGMSSTDGVIVGDTVLDHGDYSGPGGARTVLRHPDIDIGILETARGGLVRRGLAVALADAAIVTNVGDDHLGESGIDTLDDLAEVKLVVTQALGGAGKAVLNWDDQRVRAAGMSLPVSKVWFSLKPPNDELRKLLNDGDQAACLKGQALCWYYGEEIVSLISADQIPIALGGAAHHNIANCLAAAGAAITAGIALEPVRQALTTFGTSAADNPGRANMFDIDGARVMADFAHNPEGVAAIVDTARNLPHKRLLITIGQAGDRTDDSIVALTQQTYAALPDHIIVKHMNAFLRGRKPRAVSRLIHKTLLGLGAAESMIEFADSELDTLNAALHWSRPGDLLILIVHTDREIVLNRLNELSKNQ